MRAAKEDASVAHTAAARAQGPFSVSSRASHALSAAVVQEPLAGVLLSSVVQSYDAFGPRAKNTATTRGSELAFVTY